MYATETIISTCENPFLKLWLLKSMKPSASAPNRNASPSASDSMSSLCSTIFKSATEAPKQWTNSVLRSFGIPPQFCCLRASRDHHPYSFHLILARFFILVFSLQGAGFLRLFVISFAKSNPVVFFFPSYTRVSASNASKYLETRTKKMN